MDKKGYEYFYGSLTYYFDEHSCGNGGTFTIEVMGGLRKKRLDMIKDILAGEK